MRSGSLSDCPGVTGQCLFVNSGSEAIDGAMKLAKRVAQDEGIFCGIEKAYHGGTHGAMSILGDAKARSGYLPLTCQVSNIFVSTRRRILA